MCLTSRCLSLYSSNYSIAGLWTARICADHFEEVLIIEPEMWTADTEGSQGRYDENGNLKEDLRVFARQRISQYNAAHCESIYALSE